MCSSRGSRFCVPGSGQVPDTREMVTRRRRSNREGIARGLPNRDPTAVVAWEKSVAQIRAEIRLLNDVRQPVFTIERLEKAFAGLVVGSTVALWFVLYVRGDPSTHRGAFYGNAHADWLGSFMIVITTKYFYELGSAESRQPHPRTRAHFKQGSPVLGIGSAGQSGTGGR